MISDQPRPVRAVFLQGNRALLAAHRWINRVRGRNGWFVSRLERLLRWIKSPIAILVQAMAAATLCGLFLHPQGFVLALGLAAVLIVGVVWPWLSVRFLAGSLSFEKNRTREGEPTGVVLSRP